jgi:hypothetical protein
MQTLTVKLFNEEVQKPTGDITDRIKTFEDACKETGIYPSELSVSGEGITDDHMKGIAAFHKLTIIAKALNGEWVPDWNNTSEYKYYPYFDIKNGFVFYDCGCYYRSSHVGSRLCFKSDELATYAGKQFLDLYKDLFIFQ